MESQRRSEKSDIVKIDQMWMDHINEPNTPTSQRMFTTESYYMSLWEAAHHGILIVDCEGDIIEANRQALQLLKTTGAEIENCNIRDIIPDELLSMEFADFKTLIKGQRHQYARDMELTPIGRGQDLPVRVVVTRIPYSLTLPFQHSIIQIYRNSDIFNLSKIGENNKSWNDILKDVVKDKFGVILATIITLLILLFLSGTLGTNASELIRYFSCQQTQQQASPQTTNQ